LFDAYVLDIGRTGEPILSKQYWKKVFRQQRWTTAVVLVDGIIKGVWDYQTKDTQTTVTVEMFDPPTKPIQKGIEGEAARLGEFLNTAVVLEYGPIK
jgi:winged helix DNA-binding protein